MYLRIYRKALRHSKPFLNYYLQHRVAKGKEDPDRLSERRGISSVARPNRDVFWVHAASVGEAQSALTLIDALNTYLDKSRISFVVTTVTVTSATLMMKRLPDNAVHQYAPIDHPDWVRAFFDHWKPNAAFWMESELWPNMLRLLKRHHIPCALVNARMSPRSYKRWKKIGSDAAQMLGVFDVILAQTQEHKDWFDDLGAHRCVVTDNLKFSSDPLTYDEKELADLKKQIGKRPTWVFASSHKGEEELCVETHESLLKAYPDLLTIIVPRHPERRDDILKNLEGTSLNMQLRTQKPDITKKTQVYIADTLGELGLFYKLSAIAFIGRTFSDDGGGGHNPIEAALLDCATFIGPNYQNQTNLVEQMVAHDALEIVPDKAQVAPTLERYFEDTVARETLRDNGGHFADKKANVIKDVLFELEPLFLKINHVYRLPVKR